jgi:hypothetical protein
MIWRSSDVSRNSQYKLHLCQSNDGKRFFRLIEVESDADKNPQDDVFLVSQVVPNHLLEKRDVQLISESVVLSNGRSFFVDAHGVWLTETEAQEIDLGVTFEKIKWITDSVPKFASR